MSYPDVHLDEYGRAFCAEHRLEECGYCCLSFVDQNEEINENPSDRDVGVFLSDASLVDWHVRMKRKMPKIYKEGEKIFGSDTGQHPYGTKLLAYFDDDVNKPMNCTVIGSRWKKDELSDIPGMESPYSCVDQHEPVYTILINGELSLISLMDAHMGSEGAWKVVGHGSSVDERLDALARAHQNCQDPHGREADDDLGRNRSNEEGSKHDAVSPLHLQNRNIRRTMRSLNDQKSMKAWDESSDGDFIEQFFMYSFTPSERNIIMGSTSELYGIQRIAKGIISYPVDESGLQTDKSDFCVRLLIAKMASYFKHEKWGSVIVQNKRQTKFQAIEFSSCHQSCDLVPCIKITYATDPEGIEGPKIYLRGETIKIIEVPNQLAVSLESHLLNCLYNEGLNDLGGLLYHEGFLLPMEVTEDAVARIDTTQTNIPDVNFGVELELSCASGNYRPNMVASISKLAGIDFQKCSSGKGGKGGYGGKGGVFPGQKGPDPKESKRHDKWKFIYDSSIQPNEQNPNSAKFEIVSPILKGKPGLDLLSKTVTCVQDVVCVRINESMGLHVHVEAKGYSLESMKSICLQFIRFEGVMDSFLPYHRRTGSEKSHSYFESNLLSVMSYHDTMEESLNAVASCQSETDLYSLMNPGFRDRYHKLNLTNLETGHQPTIEFRQHHATSDLNEIAAWVKFCVLFVVNAGKLKMAGDKIGEDAKFDDLFKDIIACPLLQKYYSEKRAKLEIKSM